MHELLQFIAQFLKPAVSKLDPHIIHKATNELKVAEIYALRMLKMRNLPQEGHMRESVAKKLLTKLVQNYPTHGFVISRDEATELGLPIQKAEITYSRWAYVKDYYLFFCNQEHSIVNIFLDYQLDEIAENIGDNLNNNAEVDETTEIIKPEIMESNDETPRQESEPGTNPKKTNES